MIVHSITNDLRFVGNASKRLVKKPESSEYAKKETRETDLINVWLFYLNYSTSFAFVKNSVVHTAVNNV